MHQKLLKIVANLGSPKVLVVGDFMLDVYVYGNALRISPEAPVPVLKVTKTEYGCGGAASVTADLAALGALPICIGVVGKDRNGEIIIEKLTNAGADTTSLLAIDERPTITKQRLVGLAQHRHPQQLMRIDEESTEPLSEQQYEAILKAYKDNLKQADIVCLQDYNKGLLNPAICQQMIKLAVGAGKKVIVDPAFTKDYSKYAGATMIKPNRKETSEVVNFEINTVDDAARASEELLRKLNLNAIAITLDKEGTYLRTETISELIPTRARNVYDVTGAGDMVLAAIAITLAADCDYKTAVGLSNIAGGIEVEKFGAAPVTIEEIINEIVSENRGKSGKLRPLDSLLTEINWHHRQKDTVVFTNGCFDVMHRGHIEFMKLCRSQGDIVVLGLNSDKSVKAIKGPDRPINNQLDRAAVLAALETVDYITIFDEPDPLDLIKKIKPSVLVKGQDWKDKGVVGREFVESYGGKVVLAPLVKGKSSTTIIESIKRLAKKAHKQNKSCEKKT